MIHDQVIVLPNGGKCIDRAVAEAELRRIVSQVEHESAGLVEKSLEHAKTPIRTALARYLRRRGRCSPEASTARCPKRAIHNL